MRMIKIVVFAATIFAFGAIFYSGYAPHGGGYTPARAGISQVGTFGKFSFVVSSVTGKLEKTVVFTPAVTDDDSTVIAGLQAVMQISYGDHNDNDVQPVVETVGEKPYVTFTIGDHKTYFQLYKNSGGELGSARFWRR